MRNPLLFLLLLVLVPGAVHAANIYDRPLLQSPPDSARLYIYDPITKTDRNVLWSDIKNVGGPVGPAGLSLNWRDEWQPYPTSYSAGSYDAVYRLGSSYRCVQDNTGIDPATDTVGVYWLPIAVAGRDGADGPPGAGGPPGADGPPGAPGSPGAKGDKGDQGVQGIQGVTGNTGLKGDKGDAGTAGPGLIPGGTTGQVAAKKSNADYDTQWVTLGAAATLNVGTAANTVAAGNDSRFTTPSFTTATAQNLTVSGTFVNPQVKRAINVPTTNLGTPSIEEIASLPGQFSNKLRFIGAFLQEDSTNGVTWNTSTRLTANQLADLMIGEGQQYMATIIPSMTVGGSGYYRLTWDASQSGYVFLNAFYTYLNSQGNTVTLTLEARDNDTGVWSSIASGAVSGWPAHAYLPHTNTYLNAVSGKNKQVRATFAVTSASNTNAILIGSIEWLGGYPAMPRNVQTYDRNKNVTFPARVTATSFTGDGTAVTGVSAAQLGGTPAATVVNGAALGTTSLQPASVVDNLTSTNTTAPLSANQGKTLKTQIDAQSAGSAAGATALQPTGDGSGLSGITAPQVGAREKLTGNRTYYVATTGSDSNSGLAVGTPFLTLQHAIDVASNLDLGSYNAIIQMADGTYDYSAVNRIAVTRTTAATSWQHTVSQGTIQGYIIIQGNATTPRNVDIIGTISASGGTSVIVRDLKLRQTAAQGYHLLFAQTFSYLGFSNVVFGSLANTGALAAHIRSESGGFIGALGDYAIDAGTTSHIYANVGGMLWVQGKTITLNNAPVFTGAFVTLKSNGNIYIDNTYLGSATGRKYDVASGGALQGNTATLPGDAAGVAASGGSVEGAENYALSSKIGTLTNAKWCTSDGTAVNCTSDPPTGGGEGGGDMYKIIYDPTNIAASPFARANHTGTQSADSIMDGSTNKAYTAAEKTKLGAISGSNTGDETQSSIKTKLGAATNSADGYCTSADHTAFANGAALAVTAIQPGTLAVNGTKVGINSAAPQAGLDVRNAGTGALWVSNTNAPASNAGAGLFVQSLGGMGVVSGNRLGFVTFGADLDGTHATTGIGYGAAISAYATGTYAIPNGSCTAAGVPSACCTGLAAGTCTVNTPAELRFETATTGTTTRTARMKVTDSGRILMGPTLPTDDGSTAVQVNGGIKTSGDATIGGIAAESGATATGSAFAPAAPFASLYSYTLNGNATVTLPTAGVPGGVVTLNFNLTGASAYTVAWAGGTRHLIGTQPTAITANRENWWSATTRDQGANWSVFHSGVEQ